MKAEIITIGDELLIGQVVDTNSAWMAQRLNEAGIALHQITSVHDDRQHILKALDEAFSRADIVFTTGGLGPTKDDITKHVLCEYFGTTLVEDPHVRAHIHELYKERPEVLNRLTATQWLVPQSATILPNRVGSAPIMLFEKISSPSGRSLNSSEASTKRLISLPGVPYEMQVAMTEQVLPYIEAKFRAESLKAGDIIHRTILLSGIPESQLAIRIEDWEDALPQTMHLAYLPKDGTIRLRLSTYGEATAEEMDAQIAALLPLIADYVIALEDKPLETILGELLKQQNATIATAESCTGGRLAAALNALPGSSAYFMGSVVAYANEVKEQVLGVEHDTLIRYGAVSEQTVRQMAEGVRRLMHTDYAIATSGIAGPDGGTEDKPVGTVWIAWATPEGTTAERFQFGMARLRQQITQRAVTTALVELIKLLNTRDYR
jgi:nicotinamide-nucleotide amidase